MECFEFVFSFILSFFKQGSLFYCESLEELDFACFVYVFRHYSPCSPVWVSPHLYAPGIMEQREVECCFGHVSLNGKSLI